MIRVFCVCCCAVVLSISISDQVSAQRQGNPVDPSSAAYFSADDFHHARHAYRVQAGYSGLYDDCDDDAAKRYSQYIYWRNRPDPECRKPYLRLDRLIAWDLNDHRQRLVDGAGPCACDECKPGLNAAIQRHLMKAFRGSMAGRPEQPACVK